MASGSAAEGSGEESGRARRPGSVALIMLCQSMQSLAYGGLALFLPLVRRDVGLSFTEAGSLAAASALVYAFMQIPSGYLADRLGAKRLFLVGLAGTNVLAFSLAQLHSYVPMVVNQALSGIFRSLVFAPGLLLISALFPPHRRATALGLYVAGGFTSNIFLNTLGPLLVGPLGWRLLFMAFSGGGMLLLVLYGRLGAAGPAGSGRLQPSLRASLGLFRLRLMWAVGGIQYVRLAVVTGLNFWLPSLIVVDKGYPLQVAGLVVALGAAVTAPANFLGGYLSDRLRNPLLVIGTSLAALSATTFLLVQVQNLALLMLVVAVNGIFVQFYFGPLFAFPIQMLGPRSAGVTSGFGNFFANLGGFTFAYALGAVKDATGSFSGGLYALSLLCLVGVVLTLSLARMKPLVPA
ncbi:MAG: MFS transporter [Candidatus Dormibacterales bacterium]